MDDHIYHRPIYMYIEQLPLIPTHMHRPLGVRLILTQSFLVELSNFTVDISYCCIIHRNAIISNKHYCDKTVPTGVVHELVEDVF